MEMHRIRDSSIRTFGRNAIAEAIRGRLNLPVGAAHNAKSSLGIRSLRQGSEGNSPQFDEKAGIFLYGASA
jgi:hypothetical protein